MNMQGQQIGHEVDAMCAYIEMARQMIPCIRLARIVVIIEANHCHVRTGHIYNGIAARMEAGACVPYSDDPSDRERLGVWVDDKGACPRMQRD
jgi:hypothetical protein